MASLLSSWIARRGSAGSCLWYIYFAKTTMRLLPCPPCCVRACSSGDATSDGGFRRMTLLETEKASLTIWISIWPGPSEKQLQREENTHKIISIYFPKDKIISDKILNIWGEKKKHDNFTVYLLGCAAKTTSIVSTPTPMILTTACPASVFARL